jgi:hypothetical protein
MIFEPAPDEKEGGHNGVYLVIQRRYALQRPDTVQTWHWRDGRLGGRPPKVRNLFRHVQLAQYRESRSPNVRETASCTRGVLRFRVWEKYLYAGRAGDVGATGNHATALTVGGSTRLGVEMDRSSFFVTLGIGIASEDGVS